MIGDIKLWGSDVLPEGWLLCDGSAVSRTTYADLFQVIGTNYGAGDGTTTFNLPDYRDRVAVGKGTDAEFNTLGKTGGEKTHTLTTSEMPNHNHNSIKQAYTYEDNAYGVDGAFYKGQIHQGLSIPDNTSNVGGGQPHNNLQPYQVSNYIIKALNIVADSKKISELDSATEINDEDVLPIVQDGETKKVSTETLLSDVNQNISDLDDKIDTYSSYSTTEQVIGKWIDGKPIYRKTTFIEHLSDTDTNAWYNITSGADTLIDSKTIMKSNQSDKTYTLPLTGAYQEETLHIDVVKNDENIVTLYTKRSSTAHYENDPIWCTVEYTKTTD